MRVVEAAHQHGIDLRHLLQKSTMLSPGHLAVCGRRVHCVGHACLASRLEGENVVLCECASVFWLLRILVADQSCNGQDLGIPVYRAIHKKGEVMVTLPKVCNNIPTFIHARAFVAQVFVTIACRGF